jgi:UDP-N-acetylglucosamine:LPS N-acetylglucosamine transferase
VPKRVLILSASIGEGHDLPARELAKGLAEVAPDAEVLIRDTFEVAGGSWGTLLLKGSPFHSRIGWLLFDLEWFLVSKWRLTYRLAGALAVLLAGPRSVRVIRRLEPDVVVSTYPPATGVLGQLRRMRRFGRPVVSAVTDLAALRWWAHPGVDLHLVTHPESEAEVRDLAGPGPEIVAVTGLNDRRFRTPPSRSEARATLGLPAGARVVTVSGGGWAVGDLDSAVEGALDAGADAVLVLCGRNDEVKAATEARWAGEGRVRALGFTEEMPSVMRASDALVHSTAGLTVLEGIVCGCPVVSYGWGRAHIRENNAAFERFGLAAVARTPRDLEAKLRQAFTLGGEPDAAWAALPDAAAVVAERFLR